MSRTSKSIRNIFVAAVGQIAIALTGFVARKIFIIFLNTEYLGLNGLFSSILTVLSLAELGLGPAMIFSLYKPLAENNTSICQSLMNLYQKAYLIIGFVVLIIGSCITPFITFFIKDIPENITGIHIIYIMFVINASISYFFSYKRSLIIASQNQYQIDFVHTIVYFLMNGLQILILAFTQNYYFFLGVQILFTFLENLILSQKVNNIYPWIKEKSTSSNIPLFIKKEIIRNIKAMIFHRIGGIVVDSTDRILIAKFFGLLFLGLYSNYLLIFNEIKSLILIFFTGITASVGDFGVSKTCEESYELYKKIQFINFWIVSFCSICLFVLINPFIKLIWLGSEYLISMNILIVMIINFYINNMRRTILTFKEAFGLPWYDRFKPLISAAVNLFFSILLANKFGIIGVFLGTTITELCVNVWFEAYVIFKHVFNKSIKIFFKKYIIQNIIFLLNITITYTICNLLPFTSLINFVFNSLICLSISNLIIYLFYHKSNEFKYILILIYEFFPLKIKENFSNKREK